MRNVEGTFTQNIGRCFDKGRNCQTSRAKTSQIQTKAVTEVQTIVQSEKNSKEDYLQKTHTECTLTVVEMD